MPVATNAASAAAYGGTLPRITVFVMGESMIVAVD